MFEIHTSIKYKKQRKRLALSDRILLDDIVYRLANNETLERKHKDHKLKGEFKDFRECHIRPNLLLIYQKQEEILVLTCVEVGSHRMIKRRVVDDNAKLESVENIDDILAELENMNMDIDDMEFMDILKERSHIVILGAGASVATILNGDKNGKKISTMDNFLDKMGLLPILENIKLKTKSSNLEDIYSELYENDSYLEIRKIIDKKIREEFEKYELPDNPTVYDFLLLSLRGKDLIVSFNWDPLLLQAYQRVLNITKDLPELVFLHGNVLAGYCKNHDIGGLKTRICPQCQQPFTPCDLLYPIKNKNYSNNRFIRGNWQILQKHLKKAYQVTIFGYSAPKTDIVAIKTLKEAWGDKQKRNSEQFEFIDIADKDKIINTWKDFIHSHHYDFINNFFDSSLALFPRQTTEALFDRTMRCKFIEPAYRFTKDMSFDEIRKNVEILINKASNNQRGYSICN